MIGVARTWATPRLDCDICGLLRRAEHRIAGYAYHPRTEYYAKAQLLTLVLRQELAQPPDAHTGAGQTARLLSDGGGRLGQGQGGVQVRLHRFKDPARDVARQVL